MQPLSHAARLSAPAAEGGVDARRPRPRRAGTIYSGTGRMAEPEPEALSVIIDRINAQYGADWSAGGTLLIGVADDGAVTGLSADYASLAKPGKDPRDLFQLHLSNIAVASMGEATAAGVSLQIHTVNGEDLCRVHVQPSSFPVDAVVTVDKKGQFERKTAFYVRIANTTREIAAAEERHKYIAGRWAERSGATRQDRPDAAGPSDDQAPRGLRDLQGVGHAAVGVGEQRVELGPPAARTEAADGAGGLVGTGAGDDDPVRGGPGEHAEIPVARGRCQRLSVDEKVVVGQLEAPRSPALHDGLDRDLESADIAGAVPPVDPRPGDLGERVGVVDQVRDMGAGGLAPRDHRPVQGRRIDLGQHGADVGGRAHTGRECAQVVGGR